MDERPARLAARVKAVNAAHACANEFRKILIDIFRPYVGVKLFKMDGSFLAKHQGLLPQFPNRHDLMVYRNNSDYTLGWTVKANEQVIGAQHSIYYEQTFYVGEITGDTLKNVNEDACHFRTDFTAEEINTKRETLKAAKKMVSDAEGALYPFGEYDR
jgi:hypothetical protein